MAFIEFDRLAAPALPAQFGLHFIEQDLAQVGEEAAAAADLEFAEPVQRAQQHDLDEVVCMPEATPACWTLISVAMASIVK